MSAHLSEAQVGPPALAPGRRRVAPADLPAPATIMGRAGAENFPVALRILPLAVRTDLRAVYGYARLVDVLGDEYSGDRSAALDWLDAEVTRALRHPGSPPPAGEVHPLVEAVALTVTARGIDPQPLRDLIAANRQDQVVRRYATFDDLVGYCRLSANPVGRLVLGVFGAATPPRLAWSDAVCTALQLAEHWQDVAEDCAAGRVYLPAEDLHRFGVGDADLAGASASPRLRALLAFEVDRARRLLDSGAPLVASLDGWARLAVAGFVAGGYAALDAVAGAGFDPCRGAPHPTAGRVARHAARLLRGGVPVADRQGRAA